MSVLTMKLGIQVIVAPYHPRPEGGHRGHSVGVRICGDEGVEGSLHPTQPLPVLLSLYVFFPVQLLKSDLISDSKYSLQKVI